MIACPEEQGHEAKQKKRNALLQLFVFHGAPVCVCVHKEMCVFMCGTVNLNVIKIAKGLEKALYLPSFT